MPMSEGFQERLFSALPGILNLVPTPFHVYDEAGIIHRGRRLLEAFSGLEKFKEFFAVKANPNPEILKIMKSMGFGFDCSSLPEIMLAKGAGADTDNDIMYTSNNTSQQEMKSACSTEGLILNLDDISLIERVPEPFPKTICFRLNPGKRVVTPDGNPIGQPDECKYGVPWECMNNAYALAQVRGARRFGLHTMVCSNDLDHAHMVRTVQMLLKMCLQLIESGIHISFINMGGGLGIPYKPGEEEIPIEKMVRSIIELYDRHRRVLAALALYKDCVVPTPCHTPALFMESGRWVTGPCGVLVSRVINVMEKYRRFVGLDASCISSMMRPAMYHPDGGYHHISILSPELVDRDDSIVKSVAASVVGPACEDNDRFAWDRVLPEAEVGDIAIIHDTGAHCMAMANQYNARLRPAEILVRADGSVYMIRDAENYEDYVRKFLCVEIPRLATLP